ncbi:collagen alpha-1(III) chain-like [Mesoplodon densirostris]|uniref:collagen alpha-1(III) chain-like n=1 Tax=Mesoplodon densirostris TaxID=48708 RepID=UPI0028DB67C4|nr:collagen alpha-1(III) chain-like [Mesoplodon densirostris]
MSGSPLMPPLSLGSPNAAPPERRQIHVLAFFSFRGHLRSLDPCDYIELSGVTRDPLPIGARSTLGGSTRSRLINQSLFARRLRGAGGDGSCPGRVQPDSPFPTRTKLRRRGGGAWRCHAPRGAGALTPGRPTTEAGRSRVVAGQLSGAGRGDTPQPAAPAGGGGDVAEVGAGPSRMPGPHRAPSPPLGSRRPGPVVVLSGRLGPPPAPRGDYPSPRPNSRGPPGAALPRAPGLSPAMPDWASQTPAHGGRGRTPQFVHPPRQC